MTAGLFAGYSERDMAADSSLPPEYMEHNKSFKRLPPDDIMQNQFLSFLSAVGALFTPPLSISKDSDCKD